jgi:hypothetical protein
MSDLLKGNFPVGKKISAKEVQKENLEQRFEREAMKKLGGSIAFVSKKKIKWAKDKQD